VSAMDGATELTGTYLQRPPQPDPPRHPTECQLLLLLLLLLLLRLLLRLLLLLLRLPASGRHYRGCRAQPGRTPYSTWYARSAASNTLPGANCSPR